MLTFPLGRASEAIILGAGFSKALSEAMPLTDDLGNLVLAVAQANSDIPITHRPFENGLFEAWLSRIAEDQPDLSTVENLANRMLFQLCSQSLASVLEDCVDVALQDRPFDQAWILDLLGTLHARRSTVITFNQDTLIEFAVGGADLYSWNQKAWRLDQPQPRINWWDLIDCQPPLPSWRYGFGVPQPTLRLLKLHGSTNWYWTAGDESGATTACWFLPGTLPPEEGPDEAEARERELPGRVPLIVPPAAGKSTYFKTPLLTQLWQNARYALSRPTVRVGLVGYSIPPTDLVTSGMIRETLANRENPDSVFIDIVNPKPGPVRQNLQILGIDPTRIAEVQSVPAFVDQYVARAADELVEAFRRRAKSENSEGLLLTGTDVEHSRKVVGFGSVVDGELEIAVEDSEPPYTGPNIAPIGKAPALSLRDLLCQLEDSSIRRLVVVTRGEARRPVVGAADYVRNTGPGDGRWQVLRTARTVA
jgi:hypothetical protein